MDVADPIGNSVKLSDLRPYTNYRLDVRRANVGGGDTVVVASLNFSTAGVSATK